MRFPKVSTTNINGLPLGYTEVEYLEGTGTQYIDTGYIPNNNSEIEIVCNSGGVQGTNLFGYRNASASSKNITITTSSTGTTVFYTNDFNNSNYNTYRYNFESNANQILKIKLSKSERSVYNTSETFLGGNSVSCPDVFICDSTAYLMNVAGTPFFTQCFKGKVYSCKISEAGVLVRDYIPALDSNNRPCMYDKVEGKPYYNVGTDEFSYGRKIYGVEYLESSTTNARISTGILLDTFPFTARVSVSSKAEYNSFYQVIVGTTNSTNQYLIGLKSGDPDFTMKYNNIARTVGVVPVANKIYNVSTTLTATTMNMNIDGTDYTYTQALTANGEEIGLFPQNYNTSPMRIYAVQIIKGDVLVRDYVPVKDENNVGYMLDRVTHTLYENKGTGAFVVGKDTLGKSKAKLIKTKTTVSGLPYGFTEVEYIQSSGNQYIDTGIAGSSTLKIEMNGQKAGASYGVYFGAGTGNNRIQAIYFGDYNNARIGNLNTNLGPDTEKFNIVVDALNKNVIYNGTSYPFAYTSALTNLNIFIFTRNEGDSFADKATAKCWSFKIWDNNTLVRDFIPCLDSSNRPCMYDIIEGKAYYNQGTGEFTYGPKIIPVEYLESTGTQYIDTRYIPQSNIKIETDFQLTSVPTDTFATLCGSLPEQMNYSGFFVALNYTVPIQARTGLNTNPNVISTYNVNTDRYKLSLEFNKLTINGNVFTPTTLNTWYNPNNTLYFFSCSGYDKERRRIKAKIWYFKIYEGDALVRDYIPIKDENNNGYMFDKVNHTLYANAGSGNFVVGDEKVFSKVRFIEDTSVISEYTKVKCLISSGTQYIDTGFKPNNNTEYEVSGYMNPSGVFGVARWSGDSTYDTFGAHSITANPLDYYGRYSDNKYYNGPSSVFNNNIIWKHTKNNISITNADNGTVYVNENITTATFQSTYNIWIFAFNNMGSILARSVGCKMYYFKIWDNNALIRDYIPVLRNSDNKPGMYDRVTKTFFTNQGTGEFTYETL